MSSSRSASVAAACSSPFHVLEQELAIALDGVERRAQIVPEPAVRIPSRLARFAVRRRIPDNRLDEPCSACSAGAAHPVEVREHQFELKPPASSMIMSRRFGDRCCRRLHLLAQIRPERLFRARGQTRLVNVKVRRKQKLPSNRRELSRSARIFRRAKQRLDLADAGAAARPASYRNRRSRPPWPSRDRQPSHAPSAR